MTKDEHDAEAMRHVRAYAAQVKRANCLKRRIAHISQVLTELSQNLERTDDLADELGEIGSASKEIGSVDLQADLNELMAALEDRGKLESALIDHDLGSLIKRP